MEETEVDAGRLAQARLNAARGPLPLSPEQERRLAAEAELDAADRQIEQLTLELITSHVRRSAAAGASAACTLSWLSSSANRGSSSGWARGRAGWARPHLAGALCAPLPSLFTWQPVPAHTPPSPSTPPPPPPPSLCQNAADSLLGELQRDLEQAQRDASEAGRREESVLARLNQAAEVGPECACGCTGVCVCVRGG